MAKFFDRKKTTFLLFILILSLACNMPIADLIENPSKIPTTEGLDQEIKQINAEIDRNFDGFQTYHVKPFPGTENLIECKPEFDFGDRWTNNSILRFEEEEDWDRSQIKIESRNNHFLTYNIVTKDKPNTFCRLNETNLVECVYLDRDGYTVRVFNDPPYANNFQPYVLDAPKTCFTMVFEDYEKDQQLVTLETRHTTFTIPPDTVEISLLGPIPAMPVTSKSTGQYFPNGGHDALWSFEPEKIKNWSLAFLLDTDKERISGNFSGVALYHEEDPLYIVDGKADITGAILTGQYITSQTGNVITRKAPFEMTIIGRVYEPNQFATKGSVIDYLVYQDVNFHIIVEGTLKIVTSNNGTSLMEFEVSDCKNSKFNSTNKGAQLTTCSIRLVWNDIPLK